MDGVINQELIDSIITVGVLLELFYALVALMLVWLVLRLFDLTNRVRFNDVYEKIIQDSIAAALYCGLRFLGACLLVGFLLS